MLKKSGDIILDHDKENKSILFVWGKLGKNHLGVSEEIDLLGCKIIVDRNKHGIVKGLEVLYG